MGLETGVGFLFVAFFCSYVFMPPAGLNVRLQIKGTDIRNTTSEDPPPLANLPNDDSLSTSIPSPPLNEAGFQPNSTPTHHG